MKQRRPRAGWLLTVFFLATVPLLMVVDEVYALGSPVRRVLEFPLLMWVGPLGREQLSTAPISTLLLTGLLWFLNSAIWGFGLAAILRRLFGHKNNRGH